MKQKTYNRFDIDDKTLEKIAPHLTGQRGQRGGIAKDNRNFYMNTKNVGDMAGLTAWLWKTGDGALKIY